MPTLCVALLELSACAVQTQDESSGAVASDEQALGEITCPEDYTFQLHVPDAVSTLEKDSSSVYGDSVCTNAFTGLVHFDQSNFLPTIKAVYNGPKLVNNAPFPCSAAYVTAYIWYWNGARTDVRNSKPQLVLSQTTYGSVGRDGSTCVPPSVVYFGNPDHAEGFFSISAQAGVIYTLEPVAIIAQHTPS